MDGQLVFRIDPKLLQRRPPRLAFAATLQTLGKKIRSGELDSNFVVNMLDENRLLPYMIDNSKNLLDVSLGRKTSASKVGDLIVSEECIKGTYELALAFLDFVIATITRPNYKDTTKTMLASLIYVSNEIYTSHHLWTFRRPEDMDKILSRCTEIFHHIISLTEEPVTDEMNIVCLINLSQNQAHKQLLDVIVYGKNNIKKQVEELNIHSEAGLKASATVTSVRQSLFIFKKLLSFGKYLNELFDTQNISQYKSSPSQYQHGASSHNAPMTNIERALFDTSIRPGLIQHLFIYIYQEYDNTTACLALDLIKKIAKKFSMSLLASLGSEADKVCKFFVEYLGKKEPDLNLVIAILNLLSTCVKYQPGLIELFLDSNGSTASLDVVMSLLKDCKSDQNDRIYLYSHLLKFILTFWQKNHSAIAQLDKADQFWESVTYPLIKFIEENNQNKDTNRLTATVLMILAREIYCVYGNFSDRKINPNLENLMKTLANKQFLTRYSTYVREYYPTIMEFNEDKESKRILPGWRDFLVSFAKYKPFDTSEESKEQIVNDLLACLQLELKRCERLNKENIASLGETLLSTWVKWLPKNPDILDESISREQQNDSLRRGKNEKYLSLFKEMQELCYLANLAKEYLPFSFLLSFQSSVNLYMIRNLNYLISASHLQSGASNVDLLPPAMELMFLGVRIMLKFLNDGSIMKLNDESSSMKGSKTSPLRPASGSTQGVEMRFCMASIWTVRFILYISHDNVDLWNEYVQTNLKLDSLIDFLIMLITRRTGSEICIAISELLYCLSTNQKSANFLAKTGFIQQVNQAVMSCYEPPSFAKPLGIATTTKKSQQQQQQSATTTSTATTTFTTNSQMSGLHHITSSAPINLTTMSDITINNLSSSNCIALNGQVATTTDQDEWLQIYWIVIRLNISLMLTLGRDYIPMGIEFLSIHCIRICEVLELSRERPRLVNKDEELTPLRYLINLVQQHGFLWEKKDRYSYSAIMDELNKTSYALPAK